MAASEKGVISFTQRIGVQILPFANSVIDHHIRTAMPRRYFRQEQTSHKTWLNYICMDLVPLLYYGLCTIYYYGLSL